MERLEATALHRIAQAIRWHKLDTPAAISDFLLDDPDIVALMKDPANRHEVELDFIESIIVSDDLDEVDKLSAISFATPVAIRSPPPGTPQRRGGSETAASLTKLPAMKILLEGLAHDVVKAQAARCRRSRRPLAGRRDQSLPIPEFLGSCRGPSGLQKPIFWRA
jgi:hypothetical protein